MANNIVMALLKVSLSTSVILAFLLLLTPLLGKRYPAKWRYFVWLAVAIRLLIPVVFTFPGAPVQIGVPEAVLTSGHPQTDEELPMLAAPDDSQPMETAPVGDSSLYRQAETGSTAGVMFKAKMPSPAQLAVGIWLAGMAVYFSTQAVVYIRFIRKVHYNPRGEVPTYIRDKGRQLGNELGLASLPMIAVCRCVPSPILTGLLRPKLLLPHDRYSREEISFILRHELVHFHRRDLWYKLVLLVVNGFHWFNPLVYLMAIQAGRDAELSCDDEVTAGFGDDERAAYGDTILAALPRKRRMEPVFTTSFGSTKTSIKQRLKNLFDHRVKRKGMTALCSVSLCIAIVCGFFAYVPVSAATVNTDAQKLAMPTTYTMGATYRDVAHSIVATDKITKAGLAESIRSWLAQCDEEPGAYVFRQKAGEGYDTYVYYNAGGRYPWNLEVIKDSLRLDLYGNNEMVTDDGYYLMHITSPKNYENIQVYLDGEALETVAFAQTSGNMSPALFGNAPDDNGVGSGRVEQNLPLVNTQSYPLKGIESIDISYIADNITIMEGEKDRIEFKEYMSVRAKSYYAQVAIDGSKITIESGERPKQDSLKSNFPSHLVLFLPKTYHGALSIESATAAIYSDVSYTLYKLNAVSTTGKVEFYDLSAVEEIIAHVTSGKVIFHDISADSIKLSNTAGSITVHQAVGNIDIRSTGGDINLGVPEAMSFQFHASAIGSAIKTYFDEQTSKINEGDKITVLATIGQYPDLTVNISTTSGNIRIDKRRPDGSS